MTLPACGRIDGEVRERNEADWEGEVAAASRLLAPDSPSAGIDQEAQPVFAHDHRFSQSLASKDVMIPPTAQRTMAKRIGGKTVEVASSHAAMLAHPRDLAAFIGDAAAQMKQGLLRLMPPGACAPVPS